jgi:DNA repair protein RecN (Recombination protein N)
MLHRLLIRNYAIIDELTIDYGSKLNIVTGETGAGKSIVMGALQLILGQRADNSAVPADKKCVVEGIFSGGDPELIAEFIRRQDLDPSDEWVLRREISSSGKSRSFINDTPVNLAQLKEMALLLVDLHQQFDTQELGEEDFQRSVLDSLAGNNKRLSAFQKLYDTYLNRRHDLDRMKAEKELADKEADYHRFLFDELDAMGFRENELEELESESRLLEHAEGIMEDLSFIHQHLNAGSEPLIQQLRTLQGKMDQVASLLPAAAALQQRLQSCFIELRDIDDEIDGLRRSVNSNPSRLRQIHERMSEGYRLLKKHNFQTTAQLLALQQELSHKLSHAEALVFDIEKTEKETALLKDKAVEAASQISASRKNQIKELESRVNELLHRVGMPHAALRVEVLPCELNRRGIDAVEFLFQANLSKKGEQVFLPLNKVASGGELSRLMLCIKSLVAEGLRMPTLIFDEIDTGISGEAAMQVGAIMKDLSASHQIIAITHQPQIAARADKHFFVYKEMKEERIRTAVRVLDDQGRIDAIARMLGGEKPTRAAMDNAREMVQNA